MPRKSKRTLAALKGWRTRRANARARSLVAKKGWRTRLRNQRSLAAKKGWRTRRETEKQKRKRGIPKRVPRRPEPHESIQHLVSLDLKPARKKSYGKRDFIVPAPRGASFATLKRIAQETLTGPERQLLQFFKKENITISEGPPTRARKAQLR